MEPIELSERMGRWSSGRGPLYMLLATRLRRMIDNGELSPGGSLPPDRALASALAVGRSTVVAAYEQLRTEGRIVRRQGSGTRVAGHAPAAAVDTTGAPVFLHLLEPRDGVLLLACAAPDAPPPELAEAYERVPSRLAATRGDIGYHPAGHEDLRRAVAEHYRARGVPTVPEQVIVTGGGQQALSLLARALVRPGDQILVEAPTYPGALEAFREEAAVLRALPVGLCGLAAALRERRAAMAYTVATYHNPTGSVLPPLARRALVETAGAAGVPLIDDEVLAELGFPGERPPPPLAAFAQPATSPRRAAAPADRAAPPADRTAARGPRQPARRDRATAAVAKRGPGAGGPNGGAGWGVGGVPGAGLAPGGGSVISVGSLSKIVWGGLRIGWIRAPVPIVTRLARLRAVHDLGGNIPAQLAAAELLPRLPEIRRRRAAELRARHDHLRAELARRLPDWDAPPVRGGQTLWVRLPYGDGDSFAQAALRQGVAVLAGGGLDASGGSAEHVRIHFLASPDELTEAVRRLAAAWRGFDAPGGHVAGPAAMAL